MEDLEWQKKLEALHRPKYSMREVGKILHVTPQTLRRWIKTKRLVPVVLSSGAFQRHKYSEEQIMKFATENGYDSFLKEWKEQQVKEEVEKRAASLGKVETAAKGNSAKV